MKISEIIRENVEPQNGRTTLGDLATIKTNFPDADFWIIRKGDEKKVGSPTLEYSPENIGIKVTATDVLDPGYLRYVFEYLVMKGYFKDVARGTLRLKNIQVSDVSRIPIGVKRKPKPTPDFGYKDVGYKMGEPRLSKKLDENLQIKTISEFSNDIKEYNKKLDELLFNIQNIIERNN